MAKPPAESTYARIVGEVAIAWNNLERRLDSLAFMYLGVDTAVGGFILGELQNATKAELAKYLIERFEKKAAIKSHVPVTMPQSVGALGFDGDVWLGLGVVGIWAVAGACALQ